MKNYYLFAFLLFCLLIAKPVFSQNISGTINTYSAVTDIDECKTTVTVSDPAIFTSGDRAVIIQMKGAYIDTSNTSLFGRVTNISDAGNYEFVTIKDVKGYNVRLQYPLLRSYNINGRVQLIRMPHYRDARVSGTLTAQPWNGTTGGVIAVELTGTLSLGSNIDASGKGFRGGDVSLTNGNDGLSDFCLPFSSGKGGRKGEGITEIDGLRDAGIGPLANGGGGGNLHNVGGGGGGNAGAGGGSGNGNTLIAGNLSTTKGIGGNSLTYNASLNKIFAGGGGGGGQQNSLGIIGALGNGGSPGGAGGGIIIIRAAAINGNNYSIVSNGSSVTTNALFDGAGGGGAGGAIIIETKDYYNYLNLTASGGSGGNVTSGNDGAGGGGGGGIIWSSTALPYYVSVSMNGGAQGISSAGASGANGSAGLSLLGLKIPEDTTNYQPIALSNELIDFGRLVCSDTASAALSLRNIGKVVVKLTKSFFASGTNIPFSISNFSTPVVLNPDNQSEMTITFAPAEAGTFRDTLYLINEDKCLPEVIVILKGVKEKIDIAVSGLKHDTLDFGVFCPGVTKDSSFTIKNNSTFDLSVNSSAVTPPFVLASPGIFPLHLQKDSASVINIGFAGSAQNGIYTCRTELKDTCGNIYPVILKAEVRGVSASINPSGTVILCQGETTTLRAGPSGKEYRYKWNTGSVSQSIDVSSEGAYSVVIENGIGCIDSASVQVMVTPLLNAGINAEPGLVACGDSVILKAFPKADFYSYNWSTGETSPEIKVTRSGGYWVIVKTSSGCHDSVYAEVTLNPRPVAEIEPSGNIRICQGESVALNVKNPGTNKITWSNGQSGPSISVSATGNYFAVLENEFGCRDTAFSNVVVVPLPNVRLIADGPTTICDGQKRTIKAFTADTNLQFAWSNGQTGDQITVDKTGRYYLEITNSDGCKSFDSIDIKANPPLDLKILPGRELYICTGDYASLTTEKPYFSYKWSTGETTRNIRVADPGVYKLIVTDENGCTGEDSVIVKYNSIHVHFTDMQNTDFNYVCINTSVEKSISIVNDDTGSLRIKSVMLRGGSSGFSLSNPPTVPISAGSGQAVNFDISYNPLVTGPSTDTLLIEVDLPCYRIYEVPLSGTGVYKIVVWLPDVESDVNVMTDIPFRIKGNCATSIPFHINYKAVISYDARAMNPVVTGITAMTNCYYRNNDHVLEFEANDVAVTNSESRLTVIKGTPLLTDNNHVPLKIDRFEVSDPYVQVDTSFGSLFIRDICVSALLAVKELNKTTLQVYPNPAGDEAGMKIHSQETGSFSLCIYTLQGSLVESRSWSRSESSDREKEFIVNLKSYSDGVYQVMLTSPSGRKAYPLYITK